MRPAVAAINHGRIRSADGRIRSADGRIRSVGSGRCNPSQALPQGVASARTRPVPAFSLLGKGLPSYPTLWERLCLLPFRAGPTPTETPTSPLKEPTIPPALRSQCGPAARRALSVITPSLWGELEARGSVDTYQGLTSPRSTKGPPLLGIGKGAVLLPSPLVRRRVHGFMGRQRNI